MNDKSRERVWSLCCACRFGFEEERSKVIWIDVPSLGGLQPICPDCYYDLKKKLDEEDAVSDNRDEPPKADDTRGPA